MRGGEAIKTIKHLGKIMPKLISWPRWAWPSYVTCELSVIFSFHPFLGLEFQRPKTVKRRFYHKVMDWVKIS